MIADSNLVCLFDLKFLLSKGREKAEEIRDISYPVVNFMCSPVFGWQSLVTVFVFVKEEDKNLKVEINVRYAYCTTAHAFLKW